MWRSTFAPTLRLGDLVIIDNLGSHKVSGVVEAIEAREARLLFLTPYSPDINPIEHVFSKTQGAPQSGWRTNNVGTLGPDWSSPRFLRPR